MDYKETLLMLDTAFEMRGNLSKKEPNYIKRWNDNQLYEKMLAMNEGKKTFILHDGPPYANGDLHVGHILNKVIKDIIIKEKQMLGYQTPFIPGWDTHGLPIEVQVQKLGVNRKEISTLLFREKCYEYALSQVERQKEQMIRLGTIADYKHPYITFQKEYEAREIEVFGVMAEKGLIYKGLKPVYWSYSSESALAEAEIEYQDKKSPAIYVAFEVVDGKDLLPKGTKIVIWTTTPWTIPANLAISVHPDLDYVLVESSKGSMVFLESLMPQLISELELEDVKVIKTFSGREMEYIATKHPLYDRESPIILGEHVTADAGTGNVHTAPGHGEDDFIVGQKYHLDILSPVDAKGYMTKEAGQFEGLHIDEANKAVVQALEDIGALLKMSWITHSYPHDWRTKKPVIFRATDQWFASLEPIRKQLLDEINQVNWINEWGRVRLYNMIKERGDWVISRQRRWGVPLPIIYCEDQTPILEKAVFDHFVQLFREFGSNVWYEREAKDLLPANYQNAHSPNGRFTKELDTMDVWFDSGSSHTAVLIERGIGYPADLYFEGSDQYRGWFNSSLITGVATQGKAPYRSVLSHGMVLDKKGGKMSKSLGNAIDPMKVVNQIGADVLRLWVATVDYRQDVKISDELLKQVSETYRKIRNTMRFMLGNLYRFSVQDVVALNDLEGIDRFMLSKLQSIQTAVIASYEQYEFSNVVQMISNYLSNEMSRFYLDYSKDILFVEKEASHRRRQVQTVLYYHTMILSRLLSPILSFTMEEVHDHFNIEGSEKAESIFLETLTFIDELKDDQINHERFTKLMILRDDVLKALELARDQAIIKENSEALVQLSLNEEFKDLTAIEPQLRQLLKVGKVELVKTVTEPVIGQAAKISIARFDGVKCERCWNLYEVSDMADAHICKRCEKVLKDSFK